MTTVFAVGKNHIQKNKKYKTRIPGLEPGYEGQNKGCSSVFSGSLLAP
jgi:hypothetical protein